MYKGIWDTRGDAADWMECVSGERRDSGGRTRWWGGVVGIVRTQGALSLAANTAGSVMLSCLGGRLSVFSCFGFVCLIRILRAPQTSRVAGVCPFSRSEVVWSDRDNPRSGITDSLPRPDGPNLPSHVRVVAPRLISSKR